MNLFFNFIFLRIASKSNWPPKEIDPNRPKVSHFFSFLSFHWLLTLSQPNHWTSRRENTPPPHMDWVTKRNRKTQSRHKHSHFANRRTERRETNPQIRKTASGKWVGKAKVRVGERAGEEEEHTLFRTTTTLCLPNSIGPSARIPPPTRGREARNWTWERERRKNERGRRRRRGRRWGRVERTNCEESGEECVWVGVGRSKARFTSPFVSANRATVERDGGRGGEKTNRNDCRFCSNWYERFDCKFFPIFSFDFFSFFSYDNSSKLLRSHSLQEHFNKRKNFCRTRRNHSSKNEQRHSLSPSLKSVRFLFF